MWGDGEAAGSVGRFGEARRRAIGGDGEAAESDDRFAEARGRAIGGDGEAAEMYKEGLRRMKELERKAQPVKEWVMCSTCLGFVLRKKRSAMPNPGPGEVEEMLTDARKMRAVRPGTTEVVEMLTDDREMPKAPVVACPGEVVTKEILWMRRRMLMEYNRCPTCCRSLEETKPYEEDKAMGADTGSKKKMVRGGDETMATDAAGSNDKKRSKGEEGKKEKRSKEEGGEKEGKKEKRSEEEKKKNKNKRSMEERRKKKNKRSMEEERKKKKRSEEEGKKKKKMEKRSEEGKKKKMKMVASDGEAIVADLGSIRRTGERKTKMVTHRLSKEFMQNYLRAFRPTWPFSPNCDPWIQMVLAHLIAEYEVKCELHAHWQRQCDVMGYAEYQVEVTDDEDAP